MTKACLVLGFLALVPVKTSFAEPPDAAELVRQSVANFQHDAREGISWRYQQTDVMGKEGSTVTEKSEIGPLYGTPFEHLIYRNGKLAPEQERREEDKLEKATRERESETAEQRAARIHKWESERAFFNEIPEAYNFRIAGEPTINGRPAWEMEMTPRPEYVPKNSRAAMLRHIHGALWIDKEDVRWVKAAARVTQTISIGWLVARVGPGAQFEMEQQRVAPKFWMPRMIDVKASAKVLLVHNKDLTEHLTYTNFHKDTGRPGESISDNRTHKPVRRGQSFK